MTISTIWPIDRCAKALRWVDAQSTKMIALVFYVPCAGFMAFQFVDAYADTLVPGRASKAQIAFALSAPFWGVAVGPVLGATAAASLYLHERLPVAVATGFSFLAMLLWLVGGEALRLWPFLDTVHGSVLVLSTYTNPSIVAGALVGFLATALTARLAVAEFSDLKRARRSVLGDANWMTMQDAAKLLPSDGEVIIGERYRVDECRIKSLPFDPRDRTTWGPGGSAPLLTYDFAGSGHMIFFAGSGSGKTASVVIPTALTYTGPIVVLDPSSEIAPMVVEHRRRMGRKVRVLDPLAPIRVGFDAMAWLGTSKSKNKDIGALARLLLAEKAGDGSSTGAYFETQAHNLLTGLLAHVVYGDEYEGKRNLRSLRALVTLPEPSILEKIRALQSGSDNAFIKDTLGIFANMTEQTFSGVYSTASKDLQWLSLDEYADMVCGDTFSAADLAKGDTDVFLNIPADLLEEKPGIGRVIIGSLIKAMTQADSHYARTALFCLDEVTLLGPMSVLTDVCERGRKYGISLMMFYQSIGQLEKHFGRAGASSWIEGCYLTSHAGVKSLETAREVSAKCGNFTVETHGKSKSIGLGSGPFASRGTESVSAQKRPLIDAHEVLQTMRADEQIILVAGHPPLRCGRAFYFRRADMKDLVKANRFGPKATTRNR